MASTFVENDENHLTMGKIIAIANQKEVGKTTTAINLGACLGVLEYKTLLVDLDPQANASSVYGSTNRGSRILRSGRWGDDIRSHSLHPFPNLDLLPTNLTWWVPRLSWFLPNSASGSCAWRYASALRLLWTVRQAWPADAQRPHRGDSVMVPVQCEYFALEGLGKLLNTVKIVQTQLNPSLEVEGILLTMYDTRLRLANQVVGSAQHFQDLVCRRSFTATRASAKRRAMAKASSFTTPHAKAR